MQYNCAPAPLLLHADVHVALFTCTVFSVESSFHESQDLKVFLRLFLPGRVEPASSD